MFAVVSLEAFILLTTLSLLSIRVLLLVICVIMSTFCQGFGALPYLKVEDPSRRARRHRRPCRRRRPIRTETTTVLVLVLVLVLVSQGTHLTRRY